MPWKKSTYIAFPPVVENAQTYLNLKGPELKARKKKREEKGKGLDMFKHSWLTDRKTSFCDKTGKYSGTSI